MTTAMTEFLGAAEEADDLPEDDANLSVLSANGKHASLWTLTEWMHRILAWRAAEEILAADELPAYGGLFVPESFGWMYSKIDVGRKEKGAAGGKPVATGRGTSTDEQANSRQLLFANLMRGVHW